MIYRVLLVAVSAVAVPLHVIDQGNFRKASGLASSQPRRSTAALDNVFGGSFGSLAPDSADAGAVAASVDSDVEPAWATVSVSGGDGAESMGAKVTSDGGIELVPLAGGLESAGDEYLAEGTFHDQLDQVGWTSLMMRTSKTKEVDDGVKMYAAGAIEGFLTAKRIREFYHNSRAMLNMDAHNTEKLPTLKKSIKQTINSLMQMAEDGASSSSLNGQARLSLLQTWGIRDGFAASAGDGNPSLSMPDMFILNSDGVIDELMTALGGGSGESLIQRSSRKKSLRGVADTHPHVPTQSGHCTGMVHLKEDNSEVYFGHTTWESFSEMTRVWKVYDFPLQDVAAKKISFSSYPGCISSTDDYYLMDSGLAITETTLSIPQKQNYPSFQSVPDFMRIMAANRLSSTSEEWVRSMQDSATGTYSSQWMVMDYKKFTPGQELPDGSFYVFEQAPGASHYEDMSGRLREKHYWSSFDRAYFDDVRESTGDNAMERRLGNQPEAELFSKDNTPRAQITRQTEGEITSLDAMREEMTRNKGTKEPVDRSKLQVPSFAISARSDLADTDGAINKDGSPDGGVDAKITSSCLFRSLSAQAISSPSHTTVPAFKWTNAGQETWPGYPHEGLPNDANFDWVRVDAQENMLNPLDNGACQ